MSSTDKKYYEVADEINWRHPKIIKILIEKYYVLHQKMIIVNRSLINIFFFIGTLFLGGGTYVMKETQNSISAGAF